MSTAKLVCVVRSFRGARLYLVDEARGSNAFCWSANIRQAMRFDVTGAAQAAERARAEYGADCAPIDATGSTVNIAARPASFAAAARDTMAKHYRAGALNHKAFLAEMDRQAAARGEKLTAREYGALGRAAAAYCNERAAERIGRVKSMKRQAGSGRAAAARKRGAFKARA